MAMKISQYARQKRERSIAFRIPSQFTATVSLLNMSVRFYSLTLLSTYLIILCISFNLPSSIGASYAAAAASALLAAGDFHLVVAALTSSWTSDS